MEAVEAIECLHWQAKAGLVPGALEIPLILAEEKVDKASDCEKRILRISQGNSKIF